MTSNVNNRVVGSVLPSPTSCCSKGKEKNKEIEEIIPKESTPATTGSSSSFSPGASLIDAVRKDIARRKAEPHGSHSFSRSISESDLKEKIKESQLCEKYVRSSSAKGKQTRIRSLTSPLKGALSQDHISYALEIYAQKNKELKAANIVKKFFYEEFFKILGIHERIEKSQYVFLKPFLQITNPKEFCKAAKANKKYLFALQTIIGEAELNLIMHSTEKSNLKKWEKFVNDVKYLQQAPLHMVKNVYRSYFDIKSKITEINCIDTRDAFRSFFTTRTPIEQAFTINKQKISCPVFNYTPPSLTLSETESISDIKETNQCMTETECIINFFEWLIERLNSACGRSGKLICREQARLLCIGIIKKEEKEELVILLQGLLDEHGVSRDEEILEVLCALTNLKVKEESPDFLKDFCTWAFANLNKIIRKFKQQEMPIVAREIIDIFIKDHHIKICAIEIPCFRILQACTTNAFFFPSLSLRDDYCPRLFHTDNKLPRIQIFSEDTTSFNITTEPETGKFSVTHIKPHRFIKGAKNSNECYGTMDVFWKLTGKTSLGRKSIQLDKDASYQTLKKTIFSASLKCGNIKLDQSKPISDRLFIMENLNSKIKRSKK